MTYKSLSSFKYECRNFAQIEEMQKWQLRHRVAMDTPNLKKKLTLFGNSNLYP